MSLNPEGASEIVTKLIERHASLIAAAAKSASKSRAHNLRTKAAGIGEAIALLRDGSHDGDA